MATSNSYSRTCIPRAWQGIRALLVKALLAVIIGQVTAQHTDVTCTSLQWTFNSLGQSPCLIAAYLEQPCLSSGEANVPTIAPDQPYSPSSTPTSCDCSTVTYSLLSACASCQGGPVGNWSTFSQKCSQQASDRQYPLSIPPNTAVPAWAFQSIKGPDQFNLTLCKIIGDTPENITLTSSPSQTGKPSHKPDTGILVGSILGAVGGMAIIGILFGLYLTRRNKKRDQEKDYPPTFFPRKSIEPIASPSISHYAPEVWTGNLSPPPSARTHSQYLSYQPSQNASLTPTPRPYNPDDPSTFPPPLRGSISKEESGRNTL